MWMRRVVVALLVQGAVGLSVGTAAAQSAYPDRPVQFIVSSAPGGSIDILSRLIAPKLGALLGQPVITINRDGAGGIIGGMSVAKSAADGYTFLMTTSGLIVAHPSLYADNRLDMRTELTPISIVAAFPNVLIVHPSTGLDNVRDLIARARAEPGRIKYASGGNGTSNHLAAELLKYETGIDLLHVPYRGGGPAVSDLLGGQIQVMFSALTQLLPNVREGRLRALAVTSATRSKLAPEIPTMVESGYDQFVTASVSFIVAPPNTPVAIRQQINDAVAKALTTPEVEQAFAKIGAYARPMSPDELGASMAEQQRRWGKIVEQTKIAVE